MLRLRAINTLASLGPLPGLAVLHRSQRAADWKEIMSRKRSEDRPDIESIRERCDAATAGPWAAADAREEICRRAAFNPWYTCQVVVPLRGKPQYKGHNQSETIARVQMTDELSAVGCSQFIATARTDLPEFARVVVALCEWDEWDGTPEARHIVKSALRGEGPKIKKVEEHEFEDDENDITSCALCGEGPDHE